jgi:hypothetical protein
VRSARWLVLAFAAGAATAFLAGLLRKRRLAQVTGYRAPEAAPGPRAVAEQQTDALVAGPG